MAVGSSKVSSSVLPSLVSSTCSTFGDSSQPSVSIDSVFGSTSLQSSSSSSGSLFGTPSSSVLEAGTSPPASYSRSASRPFGLVEKRQKFSVVTMRTESDLALDPMLEPIDGTAGPRKMCQVTVGSNTELTPDVREETFVDELEEEMEPFRYGTNQQSTTMQFDQSVQYLEADMILQGGHFEQEDNFVPSSAQTSIDAPQVAAMQTQVSISESIGEEGGQVEMGEEEEVEWGKVMKIGMVITGQGMHYVSDNHKYIEQDHDATNLLTVDGSCR